MFKTPDYFILIQQGTFENNLIIIYVFFFFFVFFYVHRLPIIYVIINPQGAIAIPQAILPSLAYKH